MSPGSSRVELTTPIEIRATGKNDGNDSGACLEPLRRKRQSIGRTGVLTLWVSNIALLAVSGFLVGLWYNGCLPKARAGADYFRPDPIWTRIVLADWATRSITISTAILRLAMGSQTGLLMSMMAALILEDAGVPFSIAASLSIFRAVRVAPHNMWPAFKTTIRRRRSTKAYAIIIAGSLFVTAASQFASTILLSDVQNQRLGGKADETAFRRDGLQDQLSSLCSRRL